MGYYTGKALIRRRTGQPSVNIVSEYKSFRRQSDGSILPDSIKLTAETENVGEPTYEWFVVGVNESGGRKWVKIENSNSNTYNVSPPELNADGEEAWTKKTFKVTVSDTLQAVIVSDTIIIEVEEPVEVGGVNLLTRDNWEQGALDKQKPSQSAYDVLKISSTKVLRVINLVSVGYNHVYSIGNTDYEYAYVNFIGTRAGGAVYQGPTYYSEWKDKNSYVRRPRAGNNYVAVMLRKKNGGDITIDDFEKSRLKLENGTVDTDWTPSPSDSWIKYDPATDTLYVEKSFYSLGGISALGLGEGGGSSGGGGVDMLDSWVNYTEAKANYYVPSSLLVPFRSDTIAQITGLQSALNSKQNTLIAGANITISDNTISASGGMSSVAWGDITDKPTTFTPNEHTHTTDEITDLGNIATINKNNSTANYLRGDGTWATPPNTNTTYSAGNGISLSSTTFSVAGGNGLVQETSGLALGKPSTITSSTTNSVGEDSHTHALTVTKDDVGLGNVTNESKATMFTNPTFTGTVKGVTKAHVGLGNVDDVKQATKSEFDTHTANTTVHITATERTNWNDAFSEMHTHKNKEVIDELTQGHINVLNLLSEVNGNIKVDTTLWATGGISALGLGEGGSSGGGGVDMLDAWANYTEAKANYYVPSSLLVSFRDYTLDRLSTIEGGSASAITTTGTGNAITSVSKDGDTLTFEKGNTFSLSTHTHSYLPLSGGTLTGNLTVNGDITGNASSATYASAVSTSAENTGTTSRYILFANNASASGNQALKTNTGLKYVPSTNTITATLAGNASTATKVNKKLTLKFDTGTAENTSLYTYDGSAAKTIDIKAGSNVSFTKAGSSVTINSTNTVYTHPNYTAYASGLYKITTNTLGHVTGATAVVKADITALGIPAQDTVYTHPIGDGNKHVPKTGTTNSGKVLKAGATAGSISWGTLSHSDVGAASSDHTHSNMVTTNTTQSITGAKTFKERIGADLGVKIGTHATDGLIEWDATNKAFKFNGSLYATGGISALGLGEGGGSSGGGGVDMLDAWANYTTAKANYYVPSSLLVSFRDYTLDRLSTIEGGSASAITTTGTGNAITSVSKDGDTLTFEKGNTFSLSTHTHSQYLTTYTDTKYSAGTGLSLSETTFGQAITTSGSGSFVKGITQTTNGFQVNLGTPPNTNTTYTAGAGLTLSGTQFSLPVAVSGTGTFVKSVTQGTDGVSVTLGTPPNTNTTYSTGTLTDLTTGTNTTGKLQTAKNLNDWLNGKGYITSYVNTTYSAGTGLSLSETTFGQAITTSGSGSFVKGITQTTNGFQVNLGTPPNTNTTYTAGAGLTLSGTQFSLPVAVSGTGTFVKSVTQGTDGVSVTLGTPPNTNTTYSAGTGLSLSGTTFGQAITTSSLGSFVTGITQTTNGFQVNLGTPPNTTYSAGTLALLEAGANTSNRVWSAKILNDFTDGKYLQLSGGTLTGNVTAPTFTGDLTGNASTATTATKLGTATVGSTQLPFYLNAGTATAITQANLRKGLFGTTAIGSTTRPIYIDANGVPTAITGSIANSTTGSAATLTTARNINGTSFNGSASITTANWGTARNIGVVNSDGTGTAVTTSVNGSANVNLKLPATIKASLTGNASSASAVLTSAENTGTTSRYILFANNANGNQALKTDSGLRYVPGTNTITATLAGNASTATTAANLDRSILAGNGLTGGGALTENRTLTLGTPGTLSRSTTNKVEASSHTHSITTTSVGLADTIMQTNASGGTKLSNLMINNWSLLTETSGTSFNIKYGDAYKMRITTSGGGGVDFYGNLFIQDNLTAGNIVSDNDILAYEVKAYETVITPQVELGANWKIEQVGTELVFKYKGVIKQRMLSDGSIVATAGITALST